MRDLINYCLNTDEWIPYANLGIQHKELDITIIEEYIFNYNILFNSNNGGPELLKIKVIEKYLDLQDQVRLLNLFTELYANKRIENAA